MDSDVMTLTVDIFASNLVRELRVTRATFKSISGFLETFVLELRTGTC